MESIQPSTGYSDGDSTKGWVLEADFPFFFLPLVCDLYIVGDGVGSVVCGWMGYSGGAVASGDGGLHGRGCALSESESLTTSSTRGSVELQELSDNVSWFCCALDSASLFESEGPVSVSESPRVISFSLPSPRMPTKRRHVSEPFVRIHSFLFNCSLRL